MTFHVNQQPTAITEVSKAVSLVQGVTFWAHSTPFRAMCVYVCGVGGVARKDLGRASKHIFEDEEFGTPESNQRPPPPQGRTFPPTPGTDTTQQYPDF